jgi:hypothetical protein
MKAWKGQAHRFAPATVLVTAPRKFLVLCIVYKREHCPVADRQTSFLF